MDLSRSSVIDRLQSRVMSIDDFNFDRLCAPPIYSLFTQQDLDRLYNIATSVRYSGNAQKRFQAIDEVMKPRGFIKLSSGTNRVCYRFLEDDSFVAKVALDAVGISDNPREFMNQHIFKPFVTKIFEVDPTGVISFAERVIPITSREEFVSVIDNIYDIVTKWFIGEYILADIGTKYFMNYGVRRSFGPVLLDYPYVYELDGNKLYCSEPDDNSPTGRCEGVIDYDDGFNHLYCPKCGKRYRVQELAKAIQDDKIILKGRRTSKMKVTMKVNGTSVTEAKETDGLLKPATESIRKPEISVPKTGIKVSMKVNEKPVQKHETRNNPNKGKNNNYHKNNNTNNRGIVRASGNTNVKASISSPDTSKLNAQQELPRSFVASKVSEYDAENGIIIFEDTKGNKITVSTSIIPSEYLDTIVENSSVSDELALALQSVETLEAEKIDLNELVLQRTNEIRELEAKVVELEDKIDDTLIDKLKKQIEELKNGSSESDVKLLDEKNAEIERLREEVADLTKNIGDMAEQIASMTDESSNYKVEYETHINNLTEAVEKKQAQLEALEGLLQEANEKLEAVESDDSMVILPAEVDYSKESDLFDKYNKYNNISPITGLLTRLDVIEPISEGEENPNVIIFPDGNGDYLRDQDGKALCVICTNGCEITEFLGTTNDIETENEMTEAPVGAIQQ